MIDIKLLRDNPNHFKKAAERKGYKVNIDGILELDARKRLLVQEIDETRRQSNEIAAKGKDVSEADKEKGSSLREKIKVKEKELKIVEAQFNESFGLIPNPAFDEVPEGIQPKELRVVGEKPKFDFEPKDHLELGERLDILDFAAGAKVAGSQFYYLKNEGAWLELALINYTLNLLAAEGFKLLFTPDLAKSRFYLGTGYMPRGEEAQIYEVKDEDLGLVATAEVTLAGYHADEILDEKILPLKYVGLSHCFRREAGAYGKYSKGLYRVHQFTKVEMFCYTKPEESRATHEELLKLEEKIFKGLGIAYRVIEIPAGDLGAQAAKKYDLEAWLPGRGDSTGSLQGDWGEITSTSNTTDYQSRNLNIKYRTSGGETDFAHTLNGTALAASRAIIAILENYQRADGSVMIPKALQKYLPFEVISR
ncbi:MAG: serine--tRNA ligase [Parcubacteria group bacterium]|nr:serine--tRNA ligase [Parcubacteria group bacterium]